jgi:hypothetical protein
MRISQWQWLKSSLVSPNFSEPNSKATGASARARPISRAPNSSRRSGCCNSRWPTDVVPTTRRQSATASATLGVFLGRLQQRRGAHRRAGFAKGHVIGIDHAQPRESEVGHGARRRSDVERIARRHQNHAQVVSLRFGGDV